MSQTFDAGEPLDTCGSHQGSVFNKIVEKKGMSFNNTVLFFVSIFVFCAI